MFPSDELEAWLRACARAGESASYGETMLALGVPFARWRVRHLCAALADVDAAARGRGEPELAVLVVRASDRLPGQGWWLSGVPAAAGYAGPMAGPEAGAVVARLQRVAMDWWGGEGAAAGAGG